MRSSSSRAWRLAALGALAAASIALFAVSRGKWSDAIIDTGSEWGYPDALARGELLYRDVVYWFGPFTPYFHALFFRLFGSSFGTLVLAGIVGSLGILASFFLALRRVTGRRAAWIWTGIAIPALVFMPNSGGSILGMGYRIWHPAGFALLSVALSFRLASRGRMLALAGAGVCAALAGLSRLEWGLAAVAAVLVGLGVLRTRLRDFLPEAAVFIGASAILFVAVIGSFGAAAGWDALLKESPVLLRSIPVETRAASVVAGTRGWRAGLLSMLYSALLWIGLFLLVRLLALRRADPGGTPSRVWTLLAVLFGIALLAALGGASGFVVFSAAPLICAGAVLAGLVRPRRPRSAALVSLGLLGLLLSHRRLFHIGDFGYVAPPLLFALASAAGLLAGSIARLRRGEPRVRLQEAALAALAGVAAIAFLIRGLQYASDDRVPVPGTAGLVSAPAAVARELTEVAGAVRRSTGRGDGCVVFPEGMIVNYLSGRPNPIRHKLFLPGYVTRGNEPGIVEELERTRPAAVVVLNRPAGEYGRGFFGTDYGLRIYGWIVSHCRPAPSGSRHAKLFLCRSLV
ncbi:MAG: ArnT family glycosyltransferase [Thermoanaerobaculia bacterium]